jgi:hypothetical protein
VDAGCRLVPPGAGKESLNHCYLEVRALRIPYPPPYILSRSYGARPERCRESPRFAVGTSLGFHDRRERHAEPGMRARPLWCFASLAPSLPSAGAVAARTPRRSPPSSRGHGHDAHERRAGVVRTSRARGAGPPGADHEGRGRLAAGPGPDGKARMARRRVGFRGASRVLLHAEAPDDREAPGRAGGASGPIRRR